MLIQMNYDECLPNDINKERFADSYWIMFSFEGNVELPALLRTYLAKPVSWFTISFSLISVDKWRLKNDNPYKTTAQLPRKVYNPSILHKKNNTQ